MHNLRGYKENFGAKLIELMTDILVASGVDPGQRGAIVDSAKAKDALARATADDS